MASQAPRQQLQPKVKPQPQPQPQQQQQQQQLRKPVFVTVDKLLPETSGHNLVVKVVSTKTVIQRSRTNLINLRQSRISESVVGDQTGVVVFTARNEQDYLHQLKADKYWGSQAPRLVFQFEVTPFEAMDLVHASHFLGVKNLLNVAAAMVAHNLKDVQDLSSLPPDLAWCIAEHLSVQDLFCAEERSDFRGLNLETEILWEKHCKDYSQQGIVPVSKSSVYPLYNSWNLDLGPPPTSWKSLCLSTYLQQLSDRQNGDDTKRFLSEVSEKAGHGYCLTVRPAFWEWVIQGETTLFVSYVSFFTNLLKLSLSGLPLGKQAKDGTLPASRLGYLLRSLPLLQFLDVSDAGIGQDAAVALSMGLKTHKSIQVLCLANNNIENLGFAAVSMALPSVRTLKVLDVCYNGISAWVDVSTVDAFQDTLLEEMMLEGLHRPTSARCSMWSI